MFFGTDRGLRAHEPPANMLSAMGVAAAACVIIGVAPGLLYSRLPFTAPYAPYTAEHVTATLGLLAFTGLGFFLMLKHLTPEPALSLDTDWFYRRALLAVLRVVERGLGRLNGLLERVPDMIMQRFVLAAAQRLREFDSRFVDGPMVGIGRVTQTISQGMRLAVSGHAQHYALLMAAGVVIALALAVIRL
jgi:multicomponent Na+:H+ antiporter subunit D